MKRGSITVFLALSLFLVTSFIFSLLESARIVCIQNRIQLANELCMQSMFGNYQKGIWEDYHLLFLDGSWQEEDFSMNKFVKRAADELQENLAYAETFLGKSTWDLSRAAVKNIHILEYELATDNEGAVFQEQVSRQMQLEAGKEVVEGLLDLKEDGETAQGEKNASKEGWKNAWDAMENAEEIAESGKALTQSAENTGEVILQESQISSVEETDVENPMEYVKGIKNSAVLTLVLEDVSALSSKAVSGENLLKNRELKTGTSTQKTDITDRLWLQYYIQNYFANYVDTPHKGPKERCLSYEVEYILTGKQSDRENLEMVVYELLGIREAMNFVTIMQDAGKKALALSIATATVGFTGMLPLVKAVQIGILLAWSFVESVLDVRGLLAGKKVPLLKRTDQWSSDLTNCRKSIESDKKNGQTEEGMTYSEYLQMLLFLLPDKTINYRCMDLIEKNENVRMDNMLQAVEGEFEYWAEPLFWNLNFLSVGEWDAFYFNNNMRFSYLG